MEINTDHNSTEGGPNTSGQSTRTNNNQKTSERTERSKYKIPILSDRETDLTKINPKMWWEQISEYIHMTFNRNLDEIIDEGNEYMDPHTVYHIKGDLIWALGPKAKHEIMRGQWVREIKDVNLADLLTLFKKTSLPVRNVFHSRAQFFNMKQDDYETLDEYWKRLVDIERKCKFNNITAEEIITYKFAATIKDKKAREKFIKGPLKMQLELETIKLDNYNRKYGGKKPKNKKLRNDLTNSSTSSELIGHTNQARKRKPQFNEKKICSNRNCRFCGKPNWSLEHICPARRAQSNNCKKTGHFAKVCKSKTVCRINEAMSSDSNTEPWPEIDHTQSANGINRVDFHKTILLVQVQPIEFIIDTGSPVTIIPPIFNVTEMKKKNPRNLKGKKMVEVKTEKGRGITHSHTRKQKHIAKDKLGFDWLDKFEIGLHCSKKTNVLRHVEEDERREKNINEYKDLFKNNVTI